MGGMGSGRHRLHDCTDDYRMLDVRRLQREGLLKPGHGFLWSWKHNGETLASIQLNVEADRINFTYRHSKNNGEWKNQAYPVYVTRTPCTYGGQRTWFLCPAAGCGRRVAILYCGGIFACRCCYRLAYACQRETDDDRAGRRAEKIRERLGREPGILNGMGYRKPKGMRWHTFDHLQAEHDALVDKCLADVMQRFGIKIDI